MQALATSSALTDIPSTDRSAAVVRTSGFSFWQRLCAAYVRRIERCQAARQAKVDRALRDGLAYFQ
jgi:hypothetical protein